MLVLAILEGASRAGLDAEAISREAGVDRAELDSDDRIAESVEEAIWGALANRSAPGIGAEIALAWPKGTFRALEYAMLASETWGDALKCLVRYHQIIHDDELFRLEETDGRARLVYTFPHDEHAPYRRMATEFALTSIVRLARDASHQRYVADLMSLKDEDDESNLTARCGVPVEYGSDLDAVWFTEAALEHELPDADPVLVEILERTLESSLDESWPSLNRDVRRAIIARLRLGEPTLESVARSLGTSSRTLQTRLQELGTTFQSELDAARESLARDYLSHRDLGVPEIALLLGYGDSSAFYRAFRRWTQTTPRRYRLSLATTGR